MKTFSRLWWVFALIGTITTLLNPYIGFFGFFNTTELFILLMLNINITTRLNAIKGYNQGQILKSTLKGLNILTYVLPIVFFLVKSLVSGLIFMVAHSQNTIMAPYQIWSNPNEMSVILLVVEMIFNMLLLISFFGKGKIIKQIIKQYS